MKITLVDDRGYYIPMKNNDGLVSFNYRAAGPGTHTFTLTVTGEDIKLFEKQLSYNFEKGAKSSESKPRPTPQTQKTCPTCGKKIKDCKYHGVH